MSTLQPKVHLRAITERASRLLANDLNALPKEKQNARPDGCARAPLHIVAECAAVNNMIARLLKGEAFQRPSPEEREAFLKSFDTAEKAVSFLEQETQTLLAAFETLDESTLGEETDSPLGRPMTRFAIAELPAVHMMYHDGQLNYIQTLYGDDKMHW